MFCSPCTVIMEPTALSRAAAPVISLAMRRRRAEMAQAGQTIGTDRSASTNGERSGTSLLQEIDDALEQVNNGLNVDTWASEWVHEGDITSKVLPITLDSTGPPSLVRITHRAQLSGCVFRRRRIAVLTVRCVRPTDPPSRLATVISIGNAPDLCNWPAIV